MPSYEKADLGDILSKLREIKSIDAVLSIDYEKNDNTMSGDASLNISDSHLTLRIYYLGFLAGEVKEKDGIIHSKPKLDKYKSLLLVDGLKTSFFWWNITNYTVEEKEDTFLLKNSGRSISISKKTFLPLKQTVELESGDEINIYYDEPAKVEDKEIRSSGDEKETSTPQPLKPSSPALWYQSNMKIEFKNHIVRVRVKSYSVNTAQTHAGQLYQSMPLHLFAQAFPAYPQRFSRL